MYTDWCSVHVPDSLGALALCRHAVHSPQKATRSTAKIVPPRTPLRIGAMTRVQTPTPTAAAAPTATTTTTICRCHCCEATIPCRQSEPAAHSAVPYFRCLSWRASCNVGPNHPLIQCLPPRSWTVKLPPQHHPIALVNGSVRSPSVTATPNKMSKTGVVHDWLRRLCQRSVSSRATAAPASSQGGQWSNGGVETIETETSVAVAIICCLNLEHCRTIADELPLSCLHH